MPLVLDELLHGLSDLVYPPNCLICKKHITSLLPANEILCPKCLEDLKFNFPPFCPKCSRHLLEMDTAQCHHCLLHKPDFDFAWGTCLYRPPLDNLIHQFKYHQKSLWRHTFANLMIDFIKRYSFDIHQFDCLMPIPLSITRLRERGFNQSQLLAEKIANAFDLPLSLNNFCRSRHTKSQTLLFSQKERWTNIHGAFRIKHSNQLLNKNILLIDDLLTTGATASEAARTLKNSGAKTVGVLTLAITI